LGLNSYVNSDRDGDGQQYQRTAQESLRDHHSECGFRGRKGITKDDKEVGCRFLNSSHVGDEQEITGMMKENRA
jgi:hypothetical protein